MSFRFEKLEDIELKTSESKPGSEVLSSGFLKTANALQEKVLVGLLASFSDELNFSSTFHPDPELSDELFLERVKIIRFLFERMTGLKTNTEVLDFLNAHKKLKNKKYKEVQGLIQNNVRVLSTFSDVELFINAFKWGALRNRRQDNITALVTFFSKFAAEIEMLQKDLPRRPHKDLAVLVLNQNYTHQNYSTYSSHTAAEQMDQLLRCIKQACDELAHKEPNTNWLLIACEYIILPSLDKSLKNKFKDEISKLVQMYPNLHIVPGTVSYERNFDPELDPTKQAPLEARLEKMVTSYEQLTQTNRYIHSAPLMHAAKAMLDTVKYGPIDPRVGNQYIIFSNNCYGFHHHSPIQKFKKSNTLPSDANNLEPFLCDPGTESHFFRFPDFEVGVEVCADHATATVFEEGKDRIRPLIHALLSHHINVIAEKIFAEFFVQANTRTKPCLVMTHPEAEGVRLYQLDILDDQPQFEGPFAPIYPFVFRVNDLLNKTIVGMPENARERKLLEDFRERFNHEHRSTISDEIDEPPYDWMETELATLAQPKECCCFGFFKYKVSSPMKKMIAELQAMLSAERAAYPHSFDTMTQLAANASP